MTGRFAYILLLLAAAGLTAAAAWVIGFSPANIDDVAPYLAPDDADPDFVEVTIQEGQSPAAIADGLERAGVIDSATQFTVLVSLMGYDRLLQSGDYEFARDSSALGVVYRLRNGVVSGRSVTVVEGWRLEQIADVLDTVGIPREQFLAAANGANQPHDILAEVPPGQDLEGFLYPATYPVRSGDTAETMVAKMLDAFEESVPPAVAEQAAAQGLSVADVVTLASIIQREAVVPDEKPIMAQVFRSRLQIGMRLDADPTVQYALAEDPASVEQYGYWKRPLTTDDLAFDSPYNTYVYFGLPPGPISAPAADTMLAVVQPSDTNYLYFVAKGDGSHAFAETLEGHIANIEKYQTGE
jgi:UPF0755 protein